MNATKQDDAAPDIILFVKREKLSDGSFVHNVLIGDLVCHATSEDDAWELAEKIADAINEHTTETAGTCA